MVVVALIFGACGGDSGNNSSETEGDSSSSIEFSSSSRQLSSSSTAKSLSSSSIEYGTLLDRRDNQTYKTVVIGTQTWMAENLNYADSVSTTNLKGNSWCYNNSADSCAKYGRLYTWTGAMNIAISYQSASASTVVSTPQQGVCPTGWHIPTDAEWTTLENAGGDSSTAGTVLKSTSGWYNDGNGTDRYGFSALPGGYYSGSEFGSVGYNGFWWTATEYSFSSAYRRYMSYNYTDVGTYSLSKMHGRSLRCLKD